MGTAYRQNELYIVELGEEEWYGPSANKDALTESYRERARIHSCLHVVVFVLPDPVFPLYGHSKKHKVYEHRFPSADKPFKVAATFTGEVDPEVYNKLSDHDKRTMLRKVRDDLNEYARGVAGRYSIKAGDLVLETGRV